MIAINQVKSEIPWNGHRLQIRDMIDSEEVLRKKAAAVLHIDAVQIRKVEIIKHSLDARKKPQIWQVYTLGVTLLHEDMEAKIVKKCKNNNVTLVSGQAYTFPDSGSIRMNHRPVIIGMGPAGLFCGLLLARKGYRPILLERGEDVDRRILAKWNPAARIQCTVWRRRSRNLLRWQIKYTGKGQVRTKQRSHEDFCAGGSTRRDFV